MTGPVQWIAVLLMLVGALPALAEAPRYAIVVNAQNRTRDVDEDLIRLVYLKELSEWSGGLTARPIGRSEDSPEHRVLLKEVVHMVPHRLLRYWISLKQRTGQSKVRTAS